MIRKPLTTITINNDLTGNALKPGTQRLIKGFKFGDSVMPVKKGNAIRQKAAEYRSRQKKDWGSADISESYQGLAKMGPKRIKKIMSKRIRSGQ